MGRSIRSLNTLRAFSVALTCACAASTFLLAGCSQNSSDPKESIAKAQAERTRGNYGAAILAAKSAVLKMPANADARKFLGELYVDTGDGVSAEKELQKALELGASKADIERLEIRALLVSPDHADVLKRAETLSKTATDPEALVLLANAEAVSGDTSAALTRLEDVVERHPEDVYARKSLALLLTDRGKLKEAKQHLEKAIAQRPSDFELLILDGDIKTAEHRLDDAKAAYDRAAKVNNLSVLPVLGKVRALTGLKDFAGADKLLDGLKARQPDNLVVVYYQGLNAYAAGRFPVAKDRFREVLSKVPNHYLSELYLGLVLAREGKYEQAIEFISAVVRAQPNNLAARKFLSSLQMKMGKPADAIETLTPVADIAASDFDIAAMLGGAQLAAGQYDEASELLLNASRLSPKDFSVKTALAMAHVQAGAGARLVSEMEAESAKNAGDSQVTALLIFSYLNQSRWDDAVAASRSFLEKHPDDALILNSLGTALVNKQELQAARDAFASAVKAVPEFEVAQLNLLAANMALGDFDQADKVAKKILERSPKNPSAQAAAGRIAIKKANFADGVALLEGARKSSMSAFEPRVDLAEYYLNAGKLEEAATVAQEAMNLRPNAPFPIAIGAAARMMSGDFAQARELALKAKQLAPDLPLVKFVVGLQHLADGNNDLAVEELAGANKQLPKNDNVLAALTMAAIKAKRLSVATTSLVELESQAPDVPRTVELRGYLDEASGNIDAALSNALHLYEKVSTPELAMRIYDLYLVAKRPADAMAFLAAATDKFPAENALNLRFAIELAKADRVKDALRVYDALLKGEADNVVALNNSSQLLLKQNPTEAVARAERAYQLAKEDSNVADTYGYALYRMGKAEAAFDVFLTALKLHPADAELNYHFALLLSAQGDSNKATEALKRALAVDKFDSRKDAERLYQGLSGAK